MDKYITAFLIVLTVYEQPACPGKRALGKLAVKETIKMPKPKFEREVIFKV